MINMFTKRNKTSKKESFFLFYYVISFKLRHLFDQQFTNQLFRINVFQSFSMMRL
jgi:hypothetical protein